MKTYFRYMNGLDKFKPMKFFIFLKVFLITFSVQSSEFPISSKITYGKLENGLTYYIRPNQKPEEKAEIRLYVKAGSIHERDDQQGLAHLLEHMAFNGSKDFPKNKIDTYFNSIGLSLGADFNAWTSFDATVYKFQVPTDNPKHIETGIHILSDIAGFLDLEPEAFERERKIVEQEWRGDLGSGKRIWEQRKKYLYKNSIYQKRAPIGKIDIIRSFPYQAAIDYYKTWYRPDLMAVMIVGDIDPNRVKGLINKYFSRLKKPNQPIQQPDKLIPDYGKTIYSVITDSEQENSKISILNKHKRIIADTKKNYRTYLIESLVANLFKKRLDSFENDLIFGSAIGDYHLEGESQIYAIVADLNENKINQAIQFLNNEVQRALIFGFLDKEINLGKKELLTSYLQSLSDEKTRKSKSYFKELIGHFTEGEMISGIEFENQLAKELIPNITKEEVNAAFKKYVSKNNNIIEFISSDQNKTKLPDQKLYTKLTSAKPTKPYQLSLTEQPLIKKELKLAKIKFKKYYSSIQTTEIKLENGVRVFLRPSNYVNDQIFFSAKSFGGTSIEKDLNKLPAADYMAEVANISGLAGQKYGAINYKYPLKFVSVDLKIQDIFEGIKGSAFQPYTKDMFELIYSKFTDVYFYQDAFNQFKNQKIQEYKNRKLDSAYQFSSKTNEEFYLKHPRQKDFTISMIENMKLKDVENFYKDRFADASDFIFVFTGDFKTDDIIKLSQIYLGNLPSINRNEKFIDHQIKFFDDYKELEFKDNTEPNSIGFRSYSEKINYNIKERFTYYILEDIIDRLSHEKIREELNYVYSINFGTFYLEKYPKSMLSSFLYFQSNPKNTKKVFKAFDDVVKKIKKGDFKDQYFKDAQVKRLNKLKQSLKGNRFWSSAILDYTFEDQNIQVINNLDYTIKTIKKRDVVRMANKLLDNNYLQSVLLPKN